MVDGQAGRNQRVYRGRLLTMRTLLILLLSSVSALAQPVFPPAFWAPAQAAASGITADMWQTFELASLTTGELDAHDNIGTGTWTITDASSKLSLSTSGESNTLHKVNGTSDTGTNGLARDWTGGIAAIVYYEPAAAHDTATMAFWYKSASPTTFKSTYICRVGSVQMIGVKFARDGGNPYFKLIGTGTTDGSATMAAATWYWISLKAVRNSTCTLKIYSGAGVLLDTITGTAANNTGNRFYLGDASGGSDVATSDYFDDFVLDWTSAANPLGP